MVKYDGKYVLMSKGVEKMSVLISFLKLIFAAVIALAINFTICTYTIAERDYEIRKELADSGIRIENYESRKGLLILELPAKDATVDESDIMLIRKTLDALRNSDLKFSQYYVKLLEPAGSVIYSDMFSNIHKVNEKYSVTVPEKTVDNNTYKYMMKYYFAEHGIEMKAFNFYETKGLDVDALYIEILCEKSTLSDAVDKTMSKLRSYNNEGALVYRYSVVFKNSAGESLCAISVDEYYNDTIYWKSPTCAGIKTMYDN